MFKTVLSNGYALPHPNCRHEFIPYFEALEDPADVEKAIRKSKIKYDSKGQLVDVRFQKDIKAYQAWQPGNRQLNAEYLEFERMRQHYAGREEEMPYKTLAGFRRARRSQSKEYLENRKKWAQTTKEKSANPLTNAENSGIVEEQRRETNEEIIAKINNTPKHIHMDMQGKHIMGHKTYDASKSRLNANSIEDANPLVERIIRKYAGTGVFERNRNGEWLNKEIVETDEIIGYVVNKEGELVPTNIAKVHYSKKGIHIVPTLNTKNGKKK